MTASSDDDGELPDLFGEISLDKPPSDEVEPTTTAIDELPPAAAASAPPAKDGGQSLGALVAEASESISTILRGEIELAKLELRSSVKNVGVGVGFFATAGVLSVFSLVFGFIALAEGIIALGTSRWLGYLIVFGFIMVVVGLLVFLGIRKVKRVKAPERTIATSKDTIAYLKANTGSSSKRP